MAKTLAMLKNAVNQNNSVEHLGERLRRYRKKKSMTMQAVADLAGVTVGFVSQVERNLTSPSLTSLSAMANALGVHMAELFELPQPAPEVSRQTLRATYEGPGSKFEYERLSTSFPDSSLTTLVVRYPPGHSVDTMQHEGEELYFILDGSITVTVDGLTSILEQGDSIHFDSHRPHMTHNHTDKVTTMIVVNTIDLFKT